MGPNRSDLNGSCRLLLGDGGSDPQKSLHTDRREWKSEYTALPLSFSLTDPRIPCGSGHSLTMLVGMLNFPSNAWGHPPLQTKTIHTMIVLICFLCPHSYYSLATYYVWRYCLKLLLLTLVEGISLPYFTSILLPKTCFYKEWSNPLSKIFLSKNKNNLISPKLILKTVDQSLEMQKRAIFEQ